MQDIILKNIDGCTNYLKAFKNFLIFKSSRKDMILYDAHFTSCSSVDRRNISHILFLFLKQ